MPDTVFLLRYNVPALALCGRLSLLTPCHNEKLPVRLVPLPDPESLELTGWTGGALTLNLNFRPSLALYYNTPSKATETAPVFPVPIFSAHHSTEHLLNSYLQLCRIRWFPLDTRDGRLSLITLSLALNYNTPSSAIETDPVFTVQTQLIILLNSYLQLRWIRCFLLGTRSRLSTWAEGSCF